METALRLFSERGYLGVRVEDIAREAGVSRATFYKHFSEREEILAALLARLFDGAVERPVEGASDDGDVAERVKRAARALASTMLEQEQLARFVYSLPVRHEALVGDRRPQLPPALRTVDELLDEAASRGELRADVPLEMVRGHVHAAIETAMREWAAGGAAEPYDRLDQHLDVVFHGVTSDG